MSVRAIAVAVLVFSLAGAASAGGAGITCARGYSYAGYQSSTVAYGISARITVLQPPRVSAGHVAAWIGVGGPGLGRGGSDEWLQVGIAGFADLSGELYYEYVSPGMPLRYIPLGTVGVGREYVLTVVERRPGRWQVVVDGRAKSPVVALPGSHGSWRPIATGETWDGGRPACNGFSYDFQQVVAATRVGGGWRPFTPSRAIESRGYRATPRAAGFVTASA